MWDHLFWDSMSEHQKENKHNAYNLMYGRLRYIIYIYTYIYIYTRWKGRMCGNGGDYDVELKKNTYPKKKKNFPVQTQHLNRIQQSYSSATPLRTPCHSLFSRLKWRFAASKSGTVFFMSASACSAISPLTKAVNTEST